MAPWLSDIIDFVQPVTLRIALKSQNGPIQVQVGELRPDGSEKVKAMVKFCAACGAANSEGTGFCGQCGIAVGIPSATPTPPLRPTHVMPGWVLIGSGLAALAVLAALVWLLRPSELDEDRARELITMNLVETVTAPLQTEESVFPVNIGVDPQTGAFADYHLAQIDQVRNRLEPLKQAGYITFEEEHIAAYMFTSRLGNVKFHIKPTEKLRPLITEVSPNGDTLQVKVGQIVPNVIVSIEPLGDEMRLVRYTRNTELNELASLLQTSEVPPSLPDAEATLVRADGDWIVQVDGEDGH